MLTLAEARRVFTEQELTDQELLQLVSEIDRIEMLILDDLFGVDNFGVHSSK